MAHQHRHGRSEDHDVDAYAGADTPGVEVVSAGSVTSFVRKLFQMVQGECDSIVGFVAGETLVFGSEIYLETQRRNAKLQSGAGKTSVR